MARSMFVAQRGHPKPWTKMPMTSGLLAAVVEAVGVFAFLLLLLSDLFDDVEAQAERAAVASARAAAVVMRRAVRYIVVCRAGRVDLDVVVRSRTVAVGVMVDNFWFAWFTLLAVCRRLGLLLIGFGCARIDCVHDHGRCVCSVCCAR